MWISFYIAIVVIECGPPLRGCSEETHNKTSLGSIENLVSPIANANIFIEIF